MSAAGPCLGCGRPLVRRLLELGPQPVCNRFPRTAEEPEYSHPMTFGACRGCGLAQLAELPPASELKPRVDWITYNEPEPHLDGLADRLAALPGLGAGSAALGVTSKDDSLLRRLRERGVGRTRILDIARDLGEPDPRAFAETVQGLLTPELARRVAARHGRADLVIARHIFEHAHAPRTFLAALYELAKPGGRVVLEAPDCSRCFDALDFSTLWEEHSLYLTPETFRACLESSGAEVEAFESHPYALEDSMVAVARAGAGPAREPKTDSGAFERAERFARGLEPRRRDVRAWAERASRDGKLALFGAGHLGAVWLNLMGAGNRFAFVVDDNAHKKGLRMPGSRLPIVGSEALRDGGVAWALAAFQPGAEDAVIAKNRAFIERGGRFASIFPGSPRAIEVPA